MTHVKQIALAFPTGVAHLERAWIGISDYAYDHGDWTFVMSPERYSLSLQSLRGWPGEGVIAHVDTPAEARIAAELKMPIVNLSGAMRDSALPRVMVDNEAVGHLAAEHLLDCGYQRFAYFGLQRIWYSRQRGKGFVDHVQQSGGTCSVFEVPGTFNPRQSWDQGLDELQHWLKTLRPPVGLLANSDRRAGQVLEACRRIGLKVPDDIAVMGVNNDELYCEFCHPPLSTVRRSAYHVGFEAAKLLDTLMSGGQTPKRDLLIAPQDVVKRASTEALAIENEHLALAVRFIQDHVTEPFGIDDLLEVVPLSRRSLENLFKKQLRRTPYEFICEQRVKRAKRLLLDPSKFKLKQIALSCGFSSGKRMNLVFERIAGMSPSEYRRQNANRQQSGSNERRRTD